MIKRGGLVALACATVLLSLVVVGCSGSTTSGVDTTIVRGESTAVWAGMYSGKLTLNSSVKVIGGKTNKDTRTESVTLEVKLDGNVYLTLQGITIRGVMDNSGAWVVLASINDLKPLISVENIDRLDDAGCSLSKHFVKIEGSGTPPTINGDISGQQKCRRFLVAIVKLTATGALSASL